MRFSEAMQTVTRHGDGWQATVSEDWLQGRSAFGGLQAALARVRCASWCRRTCRCAPCR